jgi:hypothetical protein
VEGEGVVSVVKDLEEMAVVEMLLTALGLAVGQLAILEVVAQVLGGLIVVEVLLVGKVVVG